MRKAALALLSVVMAPGCASVAANFARYAPDYTYELVEVQRPSKATERYGPQAITTVSDSGKTKYSFEDQLIRVIALPSRTGIEFDLNNKTGFPIRIPWNDAAFVGIDGKSQQVMHLGMKYTDCTSQKAPSVIVGHGSVIEGVYPCGNLHFSSSWVVAPILPGGPVASADTARVRADLEKSVVGKTVQLLLPLQIEEVTNDYMFTFRVTGVVMSFRSFMDY